MLVMLLLGVFARLAMRRSAGLGWLILLAVKELVKLEL